MRAWVAGWARSRDLPSAEEVAAGVLRTPVGAPGRDVELLVLDADRHPRRTDVAAQASWDERDPWVTVPTADPGRVADRLAEHGLATATVPEWLMTRSLAPSPRTPLPPGYAATTRRPGPHRVEVEVDAPDGSPAAWGQVGLDGAVAVPDRIATSGAHRRRGLGSAVMTLLGDAALGSGADRGVLVASDEGRRLYLTLGWEVVGAVVVARRR
ncbi:GNAT family N-acetyltransferase [Nocardioides aurantiacus]|uniref:Acetyltransferase (GNAT) family protein n=1 Tax=Nocardioides aurantiacus TaxID=86796 RepID=A0A3N2CRB9_9ACTN|nr:GNAT family N-acetyltransferase [Nocardioides aurantiacus]ROR90097.1 acetyltransferase (GNAT) family protein [Nocardioides aurantiacus]